MSDQLSFDLPSRAAKGLDEFLVTSSNSQALSTVESWLSWPERKLILTGNEGSGKTHLAHVWAEMSDATFIDIRDLVDLDPSQFIGKNVIIEDADRRILGSELERAVFHLHNMVLAESGYLLITASKPPALWGLTLPDLKSRMLGTALVHIEPPDELLLSAVLVKLFDDRQLRVNVNVVDFLLPRIERSLSAAEDVVQRIDHVALSQKRNVTRQLTSQVLEQMPKFS